MKQLPMIIALLVFGVAHAQDWPNLHRFKEANELLVKTNAKHRVVFMGNSITEHWRKGFFKEHPNFVNRGISGQTTPQMLVRFRQDVVNLNPATVVILAGINDIAHNTGPSTTETISNNIISMIELAKANDIEVVLCSVLPANEFPWRPEIKPADKVVELNSVLKTYAESHDIDYVDYYSAMVNEQKGLQEELGSDGVHPNQKGYAIMERLILKTIGDVLKINGLPDPLKAGWEGKKVCELLKEDTSQRILKCTFPPGTGHQKHYHVAHFGYTIKGGTFRITDDDGTREIKVKDGTTWSKSKTTVHEVLNVGNTTSVYLIVEPKN